MKFWDSSAIVPLCISEANSDVVKEILSEDESMIVWWGSDFECFSAFARLRREGILSIKEEDTAREIAVVLSESWNEIIPGKEIKTIGGRLLLTHPLKAADSLQLAAAIQWADKTPSGHHFVCFDTKLRDAARKEGFILLPESFTL